MPCNMPASSRWVMDQPKPKIPFFLKIHGGIKAGGGRVGGGGGGG